MAGRNVVSLEGVRKAYAEKVPLDGVSLGLDEGDRVGVIGTNGSGKSTLLRVAAGLEPPDEGRVVHRGGLTVAHLAQQPDVDPAATPLAAAGGTREAAAVLERMGLGGLEQPVGTLSGGQRRRVALAGVLATDPDLLVLDEPTNHLDPDVVEWLEGRLLARRGTLLFVTHDRYLLERLATRIVEVEGGRAHTSHGSYGAYLQARAVRVEQAATTSRKRANLARAELEWLRRGPPARTSKARYRVERAEALVGSAAVRPDERALAIELPSRRLGSAVADAHGAGKAYGGRTVLRDVDLKVPPGARWGVVGPNGSGKSTLLGLLAGRIAPDVGSVRVGETVHVGWYGQDPAPLAPRTRVLDAVREVAEEASLVDGLVVGAGDLLERFLFDKPAQRAFVEELSGGERRRLELLRVLADAPNLLVLDEPTNDLDLDTLTVLEGYLDRWPGALLVASHDRWFLDRVCHDLFAIRADGTLRHQPGGWTAYREALQAERAAARPAGPRPPTGGAGSGGTAAGRPRKASYGERREHEQLGARIPELEARRDELTARMAAAAADHVALQRLADELADVTAELDAAEERWLHLAELLEG